jgi:L-iditol 2-dehydrogenase
MALRFHAPGDVRLEALPDPDPGAGEVVIRVDAALTCGTDRKTFRRGHPVLLGPPPAPFGHEYAGTVVASRADRFVPGDRVAGANSAPCDECRQCRRGREELCERLFPLLNGAYAEYLRIPARIVERNVHHVPAGLAPELAALVEPLACAIHGAEGATGDVAVVGRGPLGRMLSLLTGGVALGRDDGGERYDWVIEAAGTPEAWQRAIDLVRPGGTVILFGGCARGSTVAVDTYRLHYEALTLRGVFHHRPRDVAAAIELLARDGERFRPLLAGETDLAGVVGALTSGSREKVVVRPCA